MTTKLMFSPQDGYDEALSFKVRLETRGEHSSHIFIHFPQCENISISSGHVLPNGLGPAGCCLQRLGSRPLQQGVEPQLQK